MSVCFLKNKCGDVIEGFLGENEPKAEILFLLKEPHIDDVEKDDGFWFKKCVWRIKESQNRTETKYVNVLGRLAGAVLGKKVDSRDECKDILKACAYMNLYPFSGERSESDNFAEVLKALEEISCVSQFNEISKNSAAGEIAENRLKIVCDLISGHNCRFVITPGNIFYALQKALGGQKTECWMEYKNKNFYCFEYKSAKILEFWHPAYRYISKELTGNFERYIKASDIP